MDLTTQVSIKKWPDQLLDLVAFFYKNSKQNCEPLRTKSVYNKKATSSNRKIATNCDRGTWDSDT